MENRETLTLDSFQQPDVTQETQQVEAQVPKEQPEAQISAEQLEEARDLGWKSQEEYKGDPNHWVPADQFLDKVENDLGTQKGVIKRQLREQKRQAERHEKAMQEIIDLHKKDKAEAEERAREEALQEVRNNHKQAVIDGDVEAAEKYAVEAAQYIQPQVNPNQPVADRWVASNNWYNQPGNEVMTNAMNGLHTQYLNQGMSFEAALQQAENTLKASPEFRHKFTPEPARVDVQPPVMTAPQAKRPVSDPMSTSNLNDAGKAAYDAFIQMIPSGERESYSKAWLKHAYNGNERFFKVKN